MKNHPTLYPITPTKKTGIDIHKTQVLELDLDDIKIRFNHKNTKMGNQRSQLTERLQRSSRISHCGRTLTEGGKDSSLQVAQSVNHLIINREISRSIPSCVTCHGVSIVDVQLRIPLDLCSPTVHSAKCSRNRV